MTRTLTTPRLLLRPPRPADAPRVQFLCGNWNVARMLERVPHPYPDDCAADWIAAQSAAWRDGSAYTFTIEFEGAVVGVIGIERNASGAYGLGYWLGEPWWGQGLMSEAVACVLGFARHELGLETLESAYFADNPASGRIQEKHGFRVTGRDRSPCLARGGDVDGVTTVLHLGAVNETRTAP